MNAGELGLGALVALLQAVVPALESFAGGPNGMLGAEELARVLGLMGTASAEYCAQFKLMATLL
jgi:hypothetical protein